MAGRKVVRSVSAGRKPPLCSRGNRHPVARPLCFGAWTGERKKRRRGTTSGPLPASAKSSSLPSLFCCSSWQLAPSPPSLGRLLLLEPSHPLISSRSELEPGPFSPWPLSGSLSPRLSGRRPTPNSRRRTFLPSLRPPPSLSRRHSRPGHHDVPPSQAQGAPSRPVHPLREGEGECGRGGAGRVGPPG